MNNLGVVFREYKTTVLFYWCNIRSVKCSGNRAKGQGQIGMCQKKKYAQNTPFQLEFYKDARKFVGMRTSREASAGKTHVVCDSRTKLTSFRLGIH